MELFLIIHVFRYTGVDFSVLVDWDVKRQCKQSRMILMTEVLRFMSGQSVIVTDVFLSG